MDSLEPVVSTVKESFVPQKLSVGISPQKLSVGISPQTLSVDISRRRLKGRSSANTVTAEVGNE